MLDEIGKPATPEAFVALLFDLGRTKILADTLAAARQKRLTAADFTVIERRTLAMLDEVRAAAPEFEFDIEAPTDFVRERLRDLCRLARPIEWRRRDEP